MIESKDLKKRTSAGANVGDGGRGCAPPTPTLAPGDLLLSEISSMLQKRKT